MLDLIKLNEKLTELNESGKSIKLKTLIADLGLENEIDVSKRLAATIRLAGNQINRFTSWDSEKKKAIAEMIVMPRNC